MLQEPRIVSTDVESGVACPCGRWYEKADPHSVRIRLSLMLSAAQTELHRPQSFQFFSVFRALMYAVHE